MFREMLERSGLLRLEGMKAQSHLVLHYRRKLGNKAGQHRLVPEC